MNTERTSSTKPKGWLYATLGVLALIIIGLSCWLISVKGNLNTLEKEKEQQRADFQAEVDSLVRVHNELKAITENSAANWQKKTVSSWPMPRKSPDCWKRSGTTTVSNAK